MSQFFKPIGEALTEALQPITGAVSSPALMENLLADLGWEINIDDSSITNIAIAFSTVTDLVDDANDLFNDLQAGNGDQAQNIIDLVNKIKAFFQAVKVLDSSATI